MVRAIEGVYRDGKVELAEAPTGVASARVYVLFLPESNEVESDKGRANAVEQLVAHMKKGYNLGGAPYATREEIYDRTSQRQGDR